MKGGYYVKKWVTIIVMAIKVNAKKCNGVMK